MCSANYTLRFTKPSHILLLVKCMSTTLHLQGTLSVSTETEYVEA